MGLETSSLRKGGLGVWSSQVEGWGEHLTGLGIRELSVGHTNGILEVFLTNQSHVLFYGFSGERVLAEYEVLPFHEPVHLRHGHV